MDGRGRRPVGAALMAIWLAGPCARLTSVGAQESAATAAAETDPGNDSSATADALVEQGIELRKGGKDQQALAKFERAFSRGGSVRALVQMALAEQALGLWRDAHEHLQEALLKAEDPWIAEHRATIEAASIEIASQLGSLEISCNVDGAEVRLDGVLLGQTPLTRPVPLVAGANVIVVSKRGYFDIARQVNIDVGRLSRLNVVLTANPTASSTPPHGVDRPHGGGQPAAPPSAELALRPATGAGPDRSARDTLFYTALGLSALGSSAGITGYVMREINVAEYNDDARCSRILGVRRADECPKQAAAFQRGEVLAIGGFASAAVFGATATYLWLTRPSAKSQASFGCAAGVAALACSGHF